MSSNASTIELIHFNFSSIFELENQIKKDMISFSSIQPYSFNVFLLFDSDHSQITPLFAEVSTKTKRILQVTPTPDPYTVIPLQPYVMTAYLFSLLALFVTLVGAISLCSIQTPEKLPRLPLLIGRES